MDDKHLLDTPYDDLIQLGYVKNHTGECYAKYNGAQSIIHAHGVRSERGLYRVWVSNLQKMIRRGKLREAITSMIECVETGPVFQTNTVNRLAKVIVSEDIGLADPFLPIWATEWLSRYQDKLKSVSGSDDIRSANDIQHLLLELVQRLVTPPKSRLVDTLYCRYFWNKPINEVEPQTFQQAYNSFVIALDIADLHSLIFFLNKCIELGSSSGSASASGQIQIGRYRKRQPVYKVWKHLLSLSYDVIEKINLALLDLYISQETNSGRKLNLIQASLNIVYSHRILEEKEGTDSLRESPNDLSLREWKRDTTVWPASVSYDKHSIRDAEEIGRGRAFFFTHGCLLGNRTTKQWLREAEEEHKIII